VALAGTPRPAEVNPADAAIANHWPPTPVSNIKEGRWTSSGPLLFQVFSWGLFTGIRPTGSQPPVRLAARLSSLSHGPPVPRTAIADADRAPSELIAWTS